MQNLPLKQFQASLFHRWILFALGLAQAFGVVSVNNLTEESLLYIVSK